MFIHRNPQKPQRTLPVTGEMQGVNLIGERQGVNRRNTGC